MIPGNDDGAIDIEEATDGAGESKRGAEEYVVTTCSPADLTMVEAAGVELDRRF